MSRLASSYDRWSNFGIIFWMFRMAQRNLYLRMSRLSDSLGIQIVFPSKKVSKSVEDKGAVDKASFIPKVVLFSVI